MSVPRETAAAIMARIASEEGITLAELKGPSRVRKYAWPRQRAYAELRATGRFSWPQIGRFVGGRDHTTALTGVRKHLERSPPKRGDAMALQGWIS